MVELYEKDGKVGVLISKGYGAGWSTWNTPELAYDKRIIEFWLEHKDSQKFMRDVVDMEPTDAKNKVVEFLSSIGYTVYSTLGFKDLKLEFVPHGAPFRITEYDGFENIEFLDVSRFITL